MTTKYVGIINYKIRKNQGVKRGKGDKEGDKLSLLYLIPTSYLFIRFWQ
ncbi:hypothetical protein H1P_890016 [Hyella patelloides LEGE 07179]|uniref:Uncharacterized protein n=1 Tax=Hyella patelloides LEGE 07179 TaxID=945734 RepID=A0A563W502_9CYAN|nr:hypothetical protein H1P_890016 [Hyella patelloides LEGE 07179]